MKHSYTLGCDCGRCSKEAIRRNTQSLSDPQRTIYRPRFKRIRRSTRSPIVGSAEWYKTRGDDLGESPDY